MREPDWASFPHRRRAIAVALAIVALALLPAGVSADPEPKPSGTPTALGQPPDEATRELAELVETAGALGAYRDEATGEVAVVFSSGAPSPFSVSAAERLGFNVRIEYREIARQDIDAIQDELARLHSLAKGDGYFFHFDAQVGKVVVNSAEEAGIFADLMARFPGKILYTQGEGGRDTRHADTAPFWGGAGARVGAGNTSQCSTGFVVKNASNATRYMVTAGHCFALNANVISPGNGLRIGKVVNRAPFPAKDMELLGLETYGTRTYMGAAGVNASSPVKGAGPFLITFDNYCRSGVATHERCGFTAVNTNAQGCWADGCTNNLVALQGGVVAAGGDSGAPWFVKGGSDVYIRGLHIGHIGQTNYAQKWETIRDQFNVVIVTG